MTPGPRSARPERRPLGARGSEVRPESKGEQGPTRIAVSLGDPSGIGAEVTAGALARLGGQSLVPYVFGDEALFRAAASGRRTPRLPVVEAGAPLPEGGALVAVTRLAPRDRRPGRPTAAGGAAQLAYLEAAFAAVERGEADALCTAPVSKIAIQRALAGFVGHTEWLTERTRTRRTVMMLASPRLRVALVTNHLQLARVPEAVTPEGVLETLRITHTALRERFGLARPRLALCALNPHAGEEGAFGDEEARLLAPALAQARRLRLGVTGPHPADSVYSRAVGGEFDAVVALYHDQGLIAAKLLDTITGVPAVNVTLGLPIVRTSPDHGTAYDIAGQGAASPASMVAALELAAELAVEAGGARMRRARGRARPR